MTACPRCRGACGGDAFCAWCGLPLDAAVPGMAMVPPRRPVPGTVLTVQILLGLGALGTVLQLIGAVLMYAAASAVLAELGEVIGDDGGGVMGWVGGLMVLLVVVAALGVAVSIWTIVALNRASRVARLVLTVQQGLVIVGLLVPLVLVAAATGDLVVLVVAVLALPLGAVLPLLLWVPASSRRFFGEVATPPPPPPPPLPYALPYPPAYPLPSLAPLPVLDGAPWPPPVDDRTPTDTLVVPSHALPPARHGAIR